MPGIRPSEPNRTPRHGQLGRDRLGIKPLYLAERPGNLRFDQPATRIRATTTHYPSKNWRTKNWPTKNWAHEELLEDEGQAG
jgi:asparagine synthetase B (glutamine-hydrolysing)